MKIAAIIPCYKVREQILDVLARCGEEISAIYVIDDKCPQNTGKLVKENCSDSRVKVIFNPQNLGVGGAVMAGYEAALADRMEILVKIDGDGQIDPRLVPGLIDPILQQKADFTKGNRFYSYEFLRGMPWIRLFGNGMLSFITKVSCGYWNLMDPTNGFIAIHANVVREMPLRKLDKRYFFETDLLFRLYLLRAVVQEFPMTARYTSAPSSLNILHTLITFSGKHVVRFVKRIVYTYYLRDFNIASLFFIVGSFLATWGLFFGLYFWIKNAYLMVFTSTGTIMVSALPLIFGFQLILSAISYDVQNIPSKCLVQIVSHFKQIAD